MTIQLVLKLHSGEHIDSKNSVDVDKQQQNDPYISEWRDGDDEGVKYHL